MKNIKLLCVIGFCAFLTNAHAQNVLSADISYAHAQGTNDYACTLMVISNQPIDTAFFDVGTGVYDTLVINQSPVGNMYVGWTGVNITYPGMGTYTLRAKVPNWIPGITNMAASHTQMAEVTGSIIVSPLITYNWSTQWGVPVVNHMSGTYYYDPGYWTVDTDSLVYSIVPVTATGYQFPSQMGGSENIEPMYGQLTVTPASNGIYAIGIRVTDYEEITAGQFVLKGYSERVLTIDATTLGTPELTSNNWIIYPNPVADAIQLPDGNRAYDVLIFDMQGKLVLQQNAVKNVLQVQTLGAGNYTVRIMNTSDGKWSVGKFTKP